MTDPIGTAQERLARYIAEYEDAPYWGGPTRYPDPPSIADLKVIQSRIAEVERLREALDPFARIAAINEQLALDWPDDKPARDVLPGAWPTWGDLKRARAALSQHRKL